MRHWASNFWQFLQLSFAVFIILRHNRPRRTSSRWRFVSEKTAYGGKSPISPLLVCWLHLTTEFTPLVYFYPSSLSKQPLGKRQCSCVRLPFITRLPQRDRQPAMLVFRLPDVEHPETNKQKGLSWPENFKPVLQHIVHFNTTIRKSQTQEMMTWVHIVTALHLRFCCRSLLLQNLP